MSGQLKEVRDRIKSVKNTQQITKAMKMVSAAKLRRAQQAIVQMRPYANKLNDMLRNILSNLEGDVETSFGTEREIKKVCLVVVTSSRGLAGSFNANICKATVAKINTDYAEVLANGNLTMLCIGKKGYEFFSKRYPNITYNTEYLELFNDLSFDNASKVSKYLMEAFETETFDRIDITYAFFKNVATQFAKVEQFLPVEKIESEDTDSSMRAYYIFEPNKQELLEFLIPSILQTQFQKFLLDTHASEHGARMTAMDKATENAKELLGDLKISYNKARQESITKEILEIVGGAAALEDG